MFSYRNFLIFIQAAILIIAGLYFAKALLIPMSYALLLAVVLFPMCKKLERYGCPRAISITIVLLSVTILITVLLGLLLIEINLFARDLPALKQKLLELLPRVQKWLSSRAGISLELQSSWWQNAMYNLLTNPAEIIKNTLSATAESVVTLFLIPIYTGLFFI
jgi:predicted PurR-regulated permease PerM